MKSLTVKKIKRIVFIIVFLIFAYIVAANFIFAANIGYLVDDNHNSTTVPTDETYLAAFETDQINWEIAYWSAVISEYTYEKPYYPLNNLALKNLGFTTLREYSYYEIEGELEDSLMVDVGIKDVFSDDGSSFKLVAIAFRGSVPIALDDPTTIENMRQNINILSEQWKTKEASVHRGFHDQYNDFLEEILPKVNEEFNLDILQDNNSSHPVIKFWITGNSMGGALAELFTLDLVERDIKPENVITYGFATPLVGDTHLQEYSKSIGAADRIYKIVHKQDMVGFMGYGILFGKSIASDINIIQFGDNGIFDRSHHSMPRTYIPFVISQNSQLKRQQFEADLIVEDFSP